MPVYAAKKALLDGFDTVPYSALIVKLLPVLLLLYVLKYYFSGSVNGSERNMHGKVVIITGGTSGIGTEVVRELATRGAQIVLLTQYELGDPFLVDYIEDLRTNTQNELITAERVDLASLHSIRTFATKWIDNAPPRRLDMVILCANTMTPSGAKIQVTEDEVEANWGLNYLANFHLLSILSPAIRAQPSDRDVRILLATCPAYVRGELPVQASAASGDEKPSAKARKAPATTTKTSHPSTAFSPSSAYATSKLALMTFALAFQKHLSSYSRPDKNPMNARVILVDPGFTRTPGMRRYLSWGSLVGLFLYLIMYPFWWLVLKSPEQGAQTFLYAAMEAQWGRGDGGWLLKECMEINVARQDVADEGLQKALWEYSENMVQEAEKRGATARAKAKKAAEDAAKAGKKEEPKADAAKTPGSRRSRKA
ncbi:hypothetical protein MBLNU459_g1301t1 [Dothideomycetes sp. NU459]